MKKSVLYVMLLLAMATMPNMSMASEKMPASVEKTPTEIPADVKTMLDRLEEIKNMDKSELDRDERKALRKEVRDMKKKVRASGNGLYISSGALIIILLLIIIL